MENQQEIATPKNATFEEAEVQKETTLARKEKKRSIFARLFFSGVITSDLKHTKKIVYIASIAAFLSIANMFEIKFADVQFSLTIAISALAGVVLGGVFGAVAAFLGDLVGFLVNSGGFAYMPWVGINLAVIALLAGLIIGGINLKFRGALLVKVSVFAVLSFFICTVGINTTAFWLLYAKGVPYLTYATTRIFIGGQIYNCLVNYAVLYIIVPTIAKLNIVKFNY